MKETKGFSLIELIITVAILGIIMGIGAVNLKPLNNEAQQGATQLTAFLKLTRAKAMATTSAYKIEYGSGSKPDQVRVFASRAKRCSDPSSAWTPDNKLQIELPAKVNLAVDYWTYNWKLVCFDSRGFTAAYIKVQLKDDRDRVREVEVLVGGTARVVP